MHFNNLRNTVLVTMACLFTFGCGDEFGDYESQDDPLDSQLNALERGRKAPERNAPEEVRPIDGRDENLGLISCREAQPSRQAVCVDGFWSTGDRCHSDRQCRIGSTCLAPREPHCFYVAPERDPTVCPRGSAGPDTPILCAPGFEQQLVTRDGCAICAPVEDDCDAAERCRAAGLTIPQCILEYTGSRARTRALLARAADSGLTELEVLEIIACGGDESRPGVRVRPTRSRATASRTADREPSGRR
jgi:hypothetical protein